MGSVRHEQGRTERVEHLASLQALELRGQSRSAREPVVQFVDTPERSRRLPSAFAHAFVGASLAPALPPGGSNGRVALALAAAAPALDVLAFGLGIPYESPLGHRGFTHSLFFAVVVALASIPSWRRSAHHRAGWAVPSVPTLVACASPAHALRAASSRR